MLSANPAPQAELSRTGSWINRKSRKGSRQENFLRVAVVHLNPNNSKGFDDIVRGLARGIERQGHDVSLVDARRETLLTPFSYIAVGTVAVSAFSKAVPESLGVFLRTAGRLTGKRCYAFVGKSGLRKRRLLASLMRAMEEEGMYLKTSDILGTPLEAETIGSRLRIEKYLV